MCKSCAGPDLWFRKCAPEFFFYRRTRRRRRRSWKKKKRRQKEVFEEIAAGVAGQFDVGEWQVHFVEKGGFN